MTVRILHYSDVESAYDDPERIGRLAGCIESRRDDATLVVGSGDDTGPGVLALVEQGAQALDFFEAVDPDAETFGNHDFDHGPDRIRETVAESPQPWVSANIFERGERFGAETGVVPWTVADAGDARVGLVGVTTPRTPDSTPEAERLVFADPAESVREHLPALRERADHVVVLAHLAECEPLADLPGVDAVLAGHTHDFEVEWVGETPVVRQSNNGRHLAELELRPGGAPTAEFHAVAEAPTDEGVADALAERVADTGLGEVVAEVENPVERTEEAAFCGESRLGNFVADAYRWVSGADVGLCSCGGPRTGNPLAGEVRAMDLVSVVPFDNELVVGELPGARLREAFEELRPRSRYPDAPAEYAGHVSGARLRWVGGDIAEIRVGGDPLDPDRTYTVATDSYVFETDHLFSAVGDGDRVRTCGKQYDALVTYAREEGVAPEIEGRVRRE